MKKFIRKILVKILDKSHIPNLLEELVKQKHLKTLEILITNEGATFYPEATVINLQNDASKIILGTNTHIRGQLNIFKNGGKIIIGDNCYVGDLTRIWSADSVFIGSNVLISHNVNIMDTNSHETDIDERRASTIKLFKEGHPKERLNIVTASITIEDDVWINFNCVILKGVTIGKGSIIAAGTIVTKSIPPFSFVSGKAGEVIKKLPN